MKCPTCPVADGLVCRGESIPHKCGDARYRAYFASVATPGTPPKPRKPTPATQPDELIRSCLYGDPCGCSVRKCYWPQMRTVTRADCKVCMASTVMEVKR